MRTLIKDGTIIDPANKINSRLNLLIENGKIAGLMKTLPEADAVINARGKVVCPGFIDIHMHEDPVGSDGKIQQNIFLTMLRMGVTTAAAGNCGVNLFHPADYLDIADRDGTAINILMFAGHKSFREMAGAKDKYSAASPKQIDAMKTMMKEALARGCAGISFGLSYAPGAEYSEVKEAASCCSGKGKMITVHVADDAAGVFKATSDLVRTAAPLDIPIQLSHIGSMGGFGQMAPYLDQIHEYRQKDTDISCDCYPYDAFSTRIGSSTYDIGWQDRYQCGYDVCEICEGKYTGMRCTEEIFAELRRDFPRCLTVCYTMKQDDIDIAVADSRVMLASDGILDGPHGHPRAAGAFPRLISEYVRTGKISMNDAISKMTYMPAERLGLKKKGRFDTGADADAVIFDPLTIRDCSTFSDPVLPPAGIDMVIIAGQTAAVNSEIIRDDLGRSIRL
ncbi:MAG: amidohydrolase family protein [Eubacteriaceae bacterium]|nr:amidohydrolase family protein [Eubacteriaceae bacterium]